MGIEPQLGNRHTKARREIVAGIAALAVWEFVGRLYGEPLLLPWPSHIILYSFPSLAIFGGAVEPDGPIALAAIASNLAITVSRILVGLAIGASVGFLLGLASYMLGRHCAREPLLLVLLRSLPLFALIPLFVLWFAGSETGVWTYIAFAVCVVVATGVHQAIANVPRQYLIQARLLGASPTQRLITVILPAMMPELAGTARNVLGLAWAFSLGAEYTASRSGLGYLVYLSYTYADMGKIATLAAVYCLSGIAVYAVWNRAAIRLVGWAKISRNRKNA